MKQHIKIAFIIVIIYGLLYLFYFWRTPLGQTPVLDGAENITLATQISAGTLPKEPFFRSMLYPALLSIPCSLGFYYPNELFLIASFFGILFHFISTFLVFLCVKNIWKNNNAATMAIIIYGLYPPAVFFAGEPLDTTISMTFMLGSLFTYLKAIDTQEKRWFVLSGILLGIGGLMRSNLLPFGIIYIAYPIYQKNELKNTLLSIFAVAFMFLLGGLACYNHSGQFKLLPWQGASNIYSANSPYANGKYYRQTIHLPDRALGTNPARLEAELIYSKETGNKPPLNINEFNKFWLRKTITEIASNPTNWIKLISKKVYYLFNNFEQYNNKTFSFHKSITPALHYNPICYGILIILLFISLTNLKLENNEIIKFKIILISIFFLGLGIIAFYVSSRFRLPITPLLVILGSGVFRYKFFEIINLKNAIIATICCFISFSSYFEAADKSTWKEDRLLNAFACSRLGYDEEQILWSNLVLSEDPINLQAIRIKIVGFTNIALTGEYMDIKEWQTVIKELKFLNKNNLYFNDTIFLSACYAWKFENNHEKARILWIKGGGEAPNPEIYQACLIYTGETDVTNSDIIMATTTPILAAALDHQGINPKFEDENELFKAKLALEFLLEQ